MTEYNAYQEYDKKPKPPKPVPESDVYGTIFGLITIGFFIWRRISRRFKK
jgi:hypothetical protein